MTLTSVLIECIYIYIYYIYAHDAAECIMDKINIYNILLVWK